MDSGCARYGVQCVGVALLPSRHHGTFDASVPSCVVGTAGASSVYQALLPLLHHITRYWHRCVIKPALLASLAKTVSTDKNHQKLTKTAYDVTIFKFQWLEAYVLGCRFLSWRLHQLEQCDITLERRSPSTIISDLKRINGRCFYELLTMERL